MLTWTNVVFAIMKGAAKNETLRILRLGLPDEPFLTPELDDELFPAAELDDELFPAA